jgi:Family of unknown function (DUF6088)
MRKQCILAATKGFVPRGCSVSPLNFRHIGVYIFLTNEDAKLDTKSQIIRRMTRQAPFGVWTPPDFGDIGSRDAVDQALSRMVVTGDIRRITRGLYDLPRLNTLTNKQTNPDPSRVIDALARRDQARMLVDGLTAANDLGLSDACILTHDCVQSRWAHRSSHLNQLRQAACIGQADLP